ncbi:MAG: hypothetical protein IJ264_04725, partial [Clostridia bacterium]|nr:hypothetical protein [Clostridia bacterium]
VVYVSCDPATLARDCGIFKDLGYTAVKATPVDMFPRTGHCECATLLMRSAAGASFRQEGGEDTTGLN